MPPCAPLNCAPLPRLRLFKKALTALRRHGDPGASYAKKLWGRAVGELHADGRFAEVSVTQLAAAADAAEASESSEEWSSYA